MSADAVGFDVAGYVRTPVDIRPADLDLGALGSLTPLARDALSWLWSVERGILDLLRDLLVTPTHAESRVTAFLNTWAYEQFWIAQSLAAVLEANGVSVSEPEDTAVGAIRRGWDERVAPTVGAIRTNLLGEGVVAGHMASGWIDTSVVDLSYARLAVLAPRLAPLVDAVRPVKTRHLAFYADDARARLQASDGARRLGRAALARWEWPGVRYAGRANVRPVVVGLFADPAAAPALRAVDTAVAALPGLSGLAPVRRSLGRLARR